MHVIAAIEIHFEERDRFILDRFFRGFPKIEYQTALSMFPGLLEGMAPGFV